MALGKAAIKIWRDTRPSDLKESGIADALGSWEKDCKDADSLSGAQFATALKSCETMLSAIMTATSKLVPLKTSAKKNPKLLKSCDDTADLLADWKKLALQYHADVTEAQKLSTTKAVVAKATELAEEQVKMAFGKLDVMTKVIVEVVKNIRANKPVDLELGFKEVAKASFVFKNTSKFFTQAGFTDQIKSACRELKVDVDVKTPKVPTKLTDHRKQLDKYETTISNFAEEIDEAADRADSEPDLGGGNPEYEDEFKKLVAAYKENIAEMKKGEANARNLLKMAEKFGAAARGPLAGDPVMAKKIEEGKTGILKKSEEINEELVKLAVTYRESYGTLYKRREFLDPPKEDVSKYLAPLVTRMNDANLRATRIIQKIEGEFADI